MIDHKAIAAWNEANKRARLMYYAHPLASNMRQCKPYCICTRPAS